MSAWPIHLRNVSAVFVALSPYTSSFSTLLNSSFPDTPLCSAQRRFPWISSGPFTLGVHSSFSSRHYLFFLLSTLSTAAPAFYPPLPFDFRLPVDVFGLYQPRRFADSFPPCVFSPVDSRRPPSRSRFPEFFPCRFSRRFLSVGHRAVFPQNQVRFPLAQPPLVMRGNRPPPPASGSQLLPRPS